MSMVGDQIRKERKRRGLSQEELAQKAHLHRTYVSLLERNRRKPTTDVFERICDALNLKPSTVFRRMGK